MGFELGFVGMILYFKVLVFLFGKVEIFLFFRDLESVFGIFVFFNLLFVLVGFCWMTLGFCLV